MTRLRQTARDSLPRTVRIAVLADTHLPSSIRNLDALGPSIADALTGADLILHAGDVVDPSVLDWCEQFAPVLCARGGQDHFDDPRMAPVQIVEHLGWRIGMVHDVESVPPSVQTVRDLASQVYGEADLDVLIAGDSHYERLEYRDGVLLLDPGSPVFPHHRETRLGSVALIELGPDTLTAELVVLGETPGAPNPCTGVTATIGRDGLVRATVDGRAVEDLRWRARGAPPLRV